MTILSNGYTMNNSRLCFQLFFLLAAFLLSAQLSAATYKVHNQAAYQKVMTKIEAGDIVVLKNGIWKDFEILFEGKGTAEKPIQLKSQTKGKVILSGNSNLRLAGEHLVVSGLVFKNGYTPTNSVIAFRKNKNELANYSRVTETVIDAYNNPERFENENWVMMYGRHNRFDHNHLEGKSTKGVTMAVRLNTPASQNNHHRIDHNYFGPRQILGSNGGETLRIGTSHYSLTDSFTVIENNYFDRCDGELEIISSKSGKNKFIGNVFYESRGTLTMRHGNDTLIEENVFFGNGVDHTGGIRVINKRQTVRNNYMEGLAGYRFGGALVVMNGVPNSPINRYHQVEDSVIANNSLINSDHIQLAAGSDFERSAIPIRSTFSGNLIHHKNKLDPFTVYDDVSGITFADNAINGVEALTLEQGFENQDFGVLRADNGLLYPMSDALAATGIDKSVMPIQKADVGTTWYAKPDAQATFGRGNIITVQPGLDTITSALKRANDGDVLSLEAGTYTVSRILPLTKAITLASVNDSVKVDIRFERGALFEIQQGGNLKLKGLRISGAESPDSAGNTVVRTQRRSLLSNYEVVLENCDVVDLDINHSFNFMTVSKGTFADRIEIIDSNFKNITGAILSLDKESDDYGIYNAEYVTIKNSRFESVQGDLVDFYRGGTDESTFGPHFELSNSVINNVGNGKRNKSKSSAILHGVQVSNINNNNFSNSKPLKVLHTVGEPVTKIKDNVFVDTPVIEISELYSDKKDTAHLSGNDYQTTN